MSASDTFRVRVPATSANLGPGFDCLGLAVTRYLGVEAKPSSRDSFRYSGPGALPDSPDNLTHQGFQAAFARLGKVGAVEQEAAGRHAIG